MSRDSELKKNKRVATAALSYSFFLSRTVHLDIIIVLLPTDAQGNCLKTSIKIYIKTAPTCFGVITIIRERTI